MISDPDAGVGAILEADLSGCALGVVVPQTNEKGHIRLIGFSLRKSLQAGAN